MAGQPVDILIENAQYVVTLDRQRRIITDGAIAVEGDRIAAVGKTAALRQQYQARKVIDATGKIVRPGYVDGHVHVTGEHFSRGLVPDDAGPVPWVYDWMVPFYSCMEPEDEYYAAMLACMEMIRAGTTAFCEAGTITDLGSVARAMEDVGIRGVIGRFTWDLIDEPRRYRRTTSQALEQMERDIQEYHGQAAGRIKVWAELIGIETASDKLLVEAKKLADKHGVGVNFHQSWDPTQVETAMAQYGKRAIDHFADLGILGPNLRLVHMIYLDDREIDLLAQHDVKVVHCPNTALRLAYGATKAGKFPEMLARGITVAVGCDGANCSDVFDMSRAIYLAAGIWKDSRGDCTLVPAEQALEMGTIASARSILLDGEVGSLEPGKKADLAILSRARPGMNPLWNVVNCLVYAADGRDVDTVMVDGRVILEGGRFTSLDESGIYRRVNELAPKVVKRSGLPVRMRWPVE